MKTIFLSYFINERTPLYGGEESVQVLNRTEIKKGASSNTKFITMPNHVGTHIDFSRHFSDVGKTINDYPSDFWIFNNVFILNYKAKPGEIIKPEILAIDNIPVSTDMLIIYTGFGKNRGGETYWNNNPGLSPVLAKALKNRCPDLRIVGFDFISVSSYQNRLLGREAHKAFLLENDILLIEDMKLDEIENKEISNITALPLMIDQIDGAPITVVANIK